MPPLKQPEPEPVAEPESEPDTSARSGLPAYNFHFASANLLVSVAPVIEETLALCGRSLESHGVTLEALADAVTMSWRRLPFLERWQILAPETVRDVPLDQLQSALRRLGCYDEWLPAHAMDRWYDYVVVCGATCPVMLARLGFVAMLRRAYGIRFRRLVVLTGRRPLDSVADAPGRETALEVPDQSVALSLLRGISACRTEGDLARLLAPSALPVLSTDAGERLSVVDVPMQYDRLSSRRPSFSDTVKAWLETRPQPGRALFISSQPHLQRYRAALRGLLSRSGLEYDVAGPGLREDAMSWSWRTGSCSTTLAVAFDAVAHWIEEEMTYLA